MQTVEMQVDRIVGPLHHFGGLGRGNLASQTHAGDVSHPAAAALEGLDKMRLVAALGVPQLILPPQQRPAIAFLLSHGFVGSATEVLSRALETAPQLLSATCSSSAMWTANAATVTAAADSGDGRLKLSVANLSSSMHRCLEPLTTFQELKHLFESLSMSEQVDVLMPIEGGYAVRDEGAANHFRLAPAARWETVREVGLNVFVYGDGDPPPQRFLARQSRLAFDAIVRRHGLDAERTFFLKQHPAAIDAGAFHNDVVAMSHEDVLIHHERAFWEAEPTLRRIASAFRETTGRTLTRVCVPESVLPLADAVSTYLFNSQIVTTAGPEFRRVMICPSQVQAHAVASRLVESWRDEDRIFDDVHFVQVRESMAGGGGPACLRLRIPIPANQLASPLPACCWSESTDQRLRAIIESRYPRELRITDLADPELIADASEATRQIAVALR